MIEKPRPDLLTLSTTFYNLSVSRNLFSKAEMRLGLGASGTEGLSLSYYWEFIFIDDFFKRLGTEGLTKASLN